MAAYDSDPEITPDGRLKVQQELSEEDFYALVVKQDKGKPWKDKTHKERFFSVGINFIKFVVLIGLLYLFVCSLGLLSDAFRLLGGREAAEAFRNNEILTNPIADLVLGVLVTVLVQSSSTSTSIVVAMVAADTIPIRPAIFVIMGANIGTTVTNTIVAMGQIYDRNEFRRAFAGATVHDMFNWLAVFIILPVEWLSGSFGSWNGCGLLCQLTDYMTSNLKETGYEEQEFLKVITKPFTKLIIQLDKSVLSDIANNPNLTTSDVDLIKHECKTTKIIGVYTDNHTLECKPQYDTSCGFMFESVSETWSNAAVGGCLLVFALGLLMFCLIMIVKLLHSLLKGAVAKAIQKVMNAKIPKARWLTGYLAILVGTGLTILLQSSSIFTSAMTPLVGAGVLHLKRMYPLTLGANIGTTFTAILAALASDSTKIKITLQVALCHFFFNVIAILIWYPIPFMRAVPIALAKRLGNITARHRWFALVYLFFMFFILPGAILGLSIAGWEVLLGVLLPIVLFFIVIIIINVMQNRCPQSLPARCQTWDCCPSFLRSLSPYDRCCKCFNDKQKDLENQAVELETRKTSPVVTSEPAMALHNHPSQLQSQMSNGSAVVVVTSEHAGVGNGNINPAFTKESPEPNGTIQANGTVHP